MPAGSLEEGLRIRADVYIGDVSKRTREMIWEQLFAGYEVGSVVMVWASSNESGYEFQTLGPNRRLPSNSMGSIWSRFIRRIGNKIFDNPKVGGNFTRSLFIEDQEVTLRVFPAHAGMNRSRPTPAALLTSCSPHTRG